MYLLMLLNSRYKHCFMQSQTPGASCISWSTCSFTSAIPGDLNAELLPIVCLNLNSSNFKHKKNKKRGNRLELAGTEGTKQPQMATGFMRTKGGSVLLGILNARILLLHFPLGASPMFRVSPMRYIHVGLAHQLNQPDRMGPHLGTGDWTCSDAAPIAPGLLVIGIPSRLVQWSTQKRRDKNNKKHWKQ